MENPRYPKERDERRAQQHADEKRVKVMQNHPLYHKVSLKLLRDEFMSLTVANINKVVQPKTTLTKAYEKLASSSHEDSPQAHKRRRLDDPANDYDLVQFPKDLIDFAQKELAAARVPQAAPLSAAEVDSMQDEGQETEIEQIECACCFSDVPSDQTTQCDGAVPHSFCFDCTKRNVETEIGYRRSRPKCMDQSQCSALFPEHQLRRALDDKTMNHLLRLRQQEDLKKAGIEGLTGMPPLLPPGVCLQTKGGVIDE